MKDKLWFLQNTPEKQRKIFEKELEKNSKILEPMPYQKVILDKLISDPSMKETKESRSFRISESIKLLQL